MLDTKVVERISSEYWRNSQLSIARLFGRAKINNTLYILDTQTDELVREDVYRKEGKDKMNAERERKRWAKVKNGLDHGTLFGDGVKRDNELF